MNKIKTFITEYRIEIIASLAAVGAVSVAFYTGRLSAKNEIFAAIGAKDPVMISMPIKDVDVRLIVSNDILNQLQK